MDDDLLDLCKRAGLTQVAIGAESGSEELLQRITNKTSVQNTLEAIRRLARHGINSYLWFMVGYPDEPEDALERTLELALAAKKINPNVAVFLNFTTPLPGSEVFRLAVERGEVEAPRTFEDWGRFDFTRPNLTGITSEYAQRVRHFMSYIHLAYPEESSMMRYRGLLGAATRPIRILARWRLDRKSYGWPMELRALGAFRSARRALGSV